MTFSSKSLMFVFPILSFQMSSLEFEVALGIGVTFEGSILNCFDQPKQVLSWSRSKASKVKTVTTNNYKRSSFIHEKCALEIVQSESES